MGLVYSPTLIPSKSTIHAGKDTRNPWMVFRTGRKPRPIVIELHPSPTRAITTGGHSLESVECRQSDGLFHRHDPCHASIAPGRSDHQKTGRLVWVYRDEIRTTHVIIGISDIFVSSPSILGTWNGGILNFQGKCWGIVGGRFSLT